MFDYTKAIVAQDIIWCILIFIDFQSNSFAQVRSKRTKINEWLQIKQQSDNTIGANPSKSMRATIQLNPSKNYSYPCCTEQHNKNFWLILCTLILVRPKLQFFSKNCSVALLKGTCLRTHHSDAVKEKDREEKKSILRYLNPRPLVHKLSYFQELGPHRDNEEAKTS